MLIRRLALAASLALALAALSIPVSAETLDTASDNPASTSTMQVGVHFADSPFGGITVKRRVGDGLILQGIVSLNENTGSLSGRLIFDLGYKGRVFRYAGIGAGVGYESRWNGTEQYQGSIAGFSGFIGIDYPLEWFGKNTPFSTSVEVVAQGINRPENGVSHIVPRTGVDVGLSYWF